MNSNTIPIVIGLGVFAVLGLHMLVNPLPVVRMFESMAARSTDAFAEGNRRAFDPARRTQNARTFRLVGAGWLLFVAVIAAIVWSTR